MSGPPVRTTTLRNHLKEATDLRVSADAAERLTTLLVAQLDQITQHAKTAATLDERTTILDRDIDHAFDQWLQTAAPSLLTSTAMLKALNGLSNDALTDLIKQLQTQLNP